MYFSDRREINPQAKFVPDFVIESLTTFELIKLENVGTVGLFKGYVTQILTWLYHLSFHFNVDRKGTNKHRNSAKLPLHLTSHFKNTLSGLFECVSLCLCVLCPNS